MIACQRNPSDSAGGAVTALFDTILQTCYGRPMMIDGPFPPHLEQFVRDQVASGQFRSEGEVVQTALRLLEEQVQTREAAHAWLKQELDKGLNSRSSEPITKTFWNQLRGRVRADRTSDHDG